MKKSLLFAALLAGVMSANAQTEICFSDKAVEAGLTGDKATFPGGTVVGESESVTMKLAYEDSWGTTDIAFKGYNGAIVNGTEVQFVKSGVVGNTNPTPNTLDGGPTVGGVLQFDVKKDGYLVVFGKLSSNKPYYVWEGVVGQGEEPVAYALHMDWSDAAQDAYPTIDYELPADDNLLDLGAADIDKYVANNTIKWPERIVTGDDESSVAKNGVGAIIFQVYKDAETYLVNATGSKISTCGAVFTTEPITQLILTGTGSEDTEAPEPLALIGEVGDYTGGGEGEGAGINNVIIVNAEPNAIYNLSGQKVDENYKGVVVKDGKKMIQK